MALKRVIVRPAAGGVPAREVLEGVESIQAELEIEPGFPDEVLRAAEAAVASPRMPDLDRTDLPLVTLDPEGSMDLDQAVHLSARAAATSSTTRSPTSRPS